MSRQMPSFKRVRYQPMKAALHIILSAHSHHSKPDEYHGHAFVYFDTKRDIAYNSNWHLKTEQGAFERQRRETIQYLKDLRQQIDEVLPLLEAGTPDENGYMSVYASVYEVKGNK